jgi:hypothetical protein
MRRAVDPRHRGDPLREDAPLKDQRVSHCRFDEALCVAPALRSAFRTAAERRQSLQLRNFNGAGNPIIGVVRWTGPAYPSEIEVSCDSSINDPAKTCRVEKITS